MSVPFEFTSCGELCFAHSRCAWELRFEDGSRLGPMDFEQPEVLDPEAGVRLLVWRSADWLIRVDWHAAEPERMWGRIKVEGDYSPGNRLAAVVFPLATVRLSDNARVFMPVNQGVETLPVRELPFGKLESRIYKTMQFVAVYDAAHGVIFDHRDVAWNNKQFEFDHPENSCDLVYSGIQTPALPREGCHVSFETFHENSVIDFCGNWYHAARIYREWGVRQPWATAKRDNSRLREIAVWLWNRGGAEHVAAPAERLQKDSGVPVALDWYWWHSNPYDTDYPNYWPPREGEELFRRTVERLNQQGIFTQVYMNGMCWDVDNPTFADGGLDSIVILRSGELRAVPFNIFNHHRLGFICSEGKPFFERLEKQVEHLAATGLPGVYLDMIGCASYEDCFNPRHQHQPGGGTYQVAGFREFLTHLRKRFPKLKFCTEECNEAYMDLFDSVIALDPSAERMNCTPHWNYVPAFSAVYHGLLPLFGSYALPDGIPPFDPLWPSDAKLKTEKDWLTLFPYQFQVEFARGLVWGQQPMAANLTMEQIENPRLRPLYRFLCDGAGFYYENREFLFDGELLESGSLEVDQIEVAFNQRMIFTAEGQLRTIRKMLPAVLHSRWRSPEGRVGWVLCNYTNDVQTVRGSFGAIELPPASFRLVEE